MRPSFPNDGIGWPVVLFKRVQEISPRDKNAVLANRDAAMPEAPPGRLALIRIEVPQFLAGGRLQRDHMHRRRGGIQHAIHDNRIALHLRIFERVSRIVRPGHLQLVDIPPPHLRECGVTDVVRSAVDGPLRITGASSRHEQQTTEKTLQGHYEIVACAKLRKWRSELYRSTTRQPIGTCASKVFKTIHSLSENPPKSTGQLRFNPLRFAFAKCPKTASRWELSKRTS